MRNLRNSHHTRFKFDDAGSELTATAWDAADESIIIAFGPTAASSAITLKRVSNDSRSSEDAERIVSWDAPSPNPDLAVDRILDLHCFPDNKTISLVLAGGDILIVREEPQPGEEAVEIVGSVDAGITAAAWSPDEELLAVATGANTLLYMTRDFESLACITLTADDLKMSSHVSVGWGKKETQFKGRGAAKALRDPTVPEHVDEGALSELDDGQTAISWRGDGQVLAVNSILESDIKRRVIRVYSREGELESVSEPVNGLEAPLSWKPSGQLIAGVQRTSDRADVVFFERNGLRHGEFNLRLESNEIASIGGNIDLNWNVDSTVLAVSMRDRVQLWSMGNYHYYLKQEIRFDVPGTEHTSTIWHPEKALQLLCLGGNNLQRLSYSFEVCRGSIVPPHDIGLTAVIDGSILNITPLRTANVPPPMAFDEVQLTRNAIDVAFNADGTEFAVLHFDSISVWSCNYAAKPVRRAAMTSLTRLGDEIHEPIDGVFKIPDSKHLFARTDHDRIFYRNSEKDSIPVEHESITRLVDTSNLDSVVWRTSEGEEIQFLAGHSGILQIQDAGHTHRISGCTSFIVTLDHLVYTTSNHILKFVHLRPGGISIPTDALDIQDERTRSIERGAKIVTVMPSAFSLVLQMSRGNLETIYPRALVLAAIRDSVRARGWRKAFEVCRTHRVDMNILCDYMPAKFLEDVEEFVKQVEKVEFIDLFLSSLAEENVSETLYKETLTAKEEVVMKSTTENGGNLTSTSPSSKVNKICDAFLAVLHKTPERRLQNIVTTYVCKNPPDLVSGLNLVSDLRKSGQQERLEQAVEHICFLADVNQLYDTALGLYDLDVALLVAQQSQKDPREYLPYLQNLSDMESLRQRFAIDNDLKRYRKALNHLHSLDSFDEVKTYIARHELYAAAIDLYRYDNARLAELMRIYADYLSSRSRFKEAGVAYEYISDFRSAYEAYRAISMWRESLFNAALVPLPEIELNGLAQDLASALEEAKDFSSAAIIHLEYLDDLDGSVRLYCKGYQFAEAMRQLAIRQRPDLLKSVLDPSLSEASGTTTELLAEMKSQLAAQVPRLRELRQKKAEDPMAFLDGADGGDGDVPDNISLAPTDASTSGGTFMTRYTNRSMGTLATNATRKTSRNRRREERKRARGKKGTVYEEEYLVNSISRLIDRLNTVADDVGKLIEALMRRSMRERALAAQAAMEDVIAACKECMDEVFSTSVETNSANTAQQTDGENLPKPWGGEGVLWDALRSSKPQAPVLKPFERLSLLE